MNTFLIIIVIFLIVYFFYHRKKTAFSKRNQEFEENYTIDTYEFQANLWTPQTPLETLIHHGEIVKISSNKKLPNYGNETHGIWLPFIQEDNSNQQNQNEIRELEFLKKFRSIYESDLKHKEKKEIITSLFKEYKDLPQNLIDKEWYLWELMDISGVSYEISKVLYSQGFQTKHDVIRATDEELLNISGIGEKRLLQIRTHFKNS